jgi:hypothetical protein
MALITTIATAAGTDIPGGKRVDENGHLPWA